jgi:hypothetical protein
VSILTYMLSGDTGSRLRARTNYVMRKTPRWEAILWRQSLGNRQCIGINLIDMKATSTDAVVIGISAVDAVDETGYYNSSRLI